MDSSQVLAKLFYLKNTSTWTREKPFTLFIDVSKVSGAQNSNIEKDPIDKIPIRDVRSCELSLELDQNGFEVMDLEQEGHTPMCFDEEDWIENEYLKFLCNKIKERLGAKEVRPYEYKVPAHTPIYQHLNELNMLTTHFRSGIDTQALGILVFAVMTGSILRFLKSMPVSGSTSMKDF